MSVYSMVLIVFISIYTVCLKVFDNFLEDYHHTSQECIVVEIASCIISSTLQNGFHGMTAITMFLFFLYTKIVPLFSGICLFIFSYGGCSMPSMVGYN